MATKFFRKNNQRRTVLSCAAHSPSEGHLSRVARLFCLLLLLTATFCAAAQNGITLSGFVMDAGTVTFNVSWKNTGMPAIWSDTVWVWVDYNTAGTMTRLPLAPGATLTATSASGTGRVIEAPNNNKGVWVVGNARTNTSFSATVKLLTATANAFAACAYASNYPPVGTYTSVTNISFRGTRPYDLVLKHTDGSTTVTRVTGGSFTIPAGYTLESFTDKTGAPGFIVCMPMSGNINFVVTPNPVQTGRAATFTMNAVPAVPSAVTYNWSAAGFMPATHTGTTFSATAPAAPGVYDVTLTARSTAYCDLTRMNAVTAMDCIASAVYDLKASATEFCTGATVTFALSNTTSGRTYQLYKGSDVVNTLTGTGGAATFTGTFAGAGVYTAQVVAEGGNCAAVMTGTHEVSEKNLPTAPTITKPADVCYNSGALVFTASGYSGILEWTANGGGTPSGSSVTFANGAATGTKTVTARAAQSYSSTLTCYSTTVTQSAAVNPLPVVSSVSGNSRCDEGVVTLSASMSGDITSAMTYTWTVGGSSYTTATNSYTTASLSSSAAYTVKAINANNCESNTASGNITVTFPAGNGQTANSCGCATGTTNCSGTCRTDNDYTTNDGACTGACTNLAYVRLRNVCGTVINSQYSTYSNSSCYAADYTTNDGSCTGNCNYAYVRLRDGCTGAVKNSQYSTYYTTSCGASDYTTNDGACTSQCNRAYVRLRDGCTGAVINPTYSTYTNSSCTSGCCTPATNGQPIGSCGCASGLTNCSGTCKSSCNATYSTCPRSSYMASMGMIGGSPQVCPCGPAPWSGAASCAADCGAAGYNYYYQFYEDISDRSCVCGACLCCN